MMPTVSDAKGVIPVFRTPKAKTFRTFCEECVCPDCRAQRREEEKERWRRYRMIGESFASYKKRMAGR